jgi:hypothetical protein
VRTQLPYALLAAAVAILVGYLGYAATGVPAWILLVVGAAIIVVWIRLIGRTLV